MASRALSAIINPTTDISTGPTKNATAGFVDPQQKDWIVMNDTAGAVNALGVQNNVTGSAVVLYPDGANVDATAGMTIRALTTGTLTLGGASNTVTFGGSTVNFGSLAIAALTATNMVVTSLTATTINTAALTATTFSLNNRSVGSVKFADLTVAALTNNVNVPSIPAGFANIVIEGHGRVTGAVSNGLVVLTLNNDATGNYDLTQNLQNGAGPSASTYSAGASNAVVGSFAGASATRTSAAGNFRVVIPDYATTSFEHNISSYGGQVDSTSTSSFIIRTENNWRSTVAVSGISIGLSTGTTFATNSRFVVYLEN